MNINTKLIELVCQLFNEWGDNVNESRSKAELTVGSREIKLESTTKDKLVITATILAKDGYIVRVFKTPFYGDELITVDTEMYIWDKNERKYIGTGSYNE